MYRILLIIVLALVSLTTYCQSTFVAGDIAFVAINSDGDDDKFAFVFLKDIDAGAQINFTDNGWTTAGSFNAIYPESHFTWTASSAISAGAVEVITTHNGNEMPTAMLGTITGEKMTLSVAGDQILAYEGLKTSPNFIAAISFNQNSASQPGINFDGESTSNSTTALPAGLIMGETAIHIYDNDNFSEQDNGAYNMLFTNGDRDELLQTINNNSNWNKNNGVPFVVESSSNAFSVSTATSSLATEQATELMTWQVSNRQLVVNINTAGEYVLRLYNLNGTVVSITHTVKGEIRSNVQISHLPKGVYVLQAVSNKNKLTQKVRL